MKQPTSEVVMTLRLDRKVHDELLKRATVNFRTLQKEIQKTLKDAVEKKPCLPA